MKILLSKISRLIVFTFTICLLSYTNALAQGECLSTGCSNAGINFGAVQNTTSTSFVNAVAGTLSGEYNTYNVTAGNTYEWSLCSADGATSSGDVELTLKTAANVILCHSEDFCSNKPRIQWTATFTGQVRVLITVFPCATSSNNNTVRWRCTTCSGSAYNPCASIGSANACGSGNLSLLSSGNGSWALGPFTPDGREKIWTFTPTQTGAYTISQSINTGGGFIDYFFKDASTGCNVIGWTFIDDLTGTGGTTPTFNLTAGTTYYIMADPEDTGGSILTFTINCPAWDPCTQIVNYSPCGSTLSVNWPSGSGSWNSYGGPSSTPGKEKILAFTPAITGSYTIETNTTSGSSSDIDLFYKIAIPTCQSSGWTHVAELSSGDITNPLLLTAGVTYHFLFDPQTTSSITRDVEISCPLPSPCDNPFIPIPSCGSAVSANWSSGNGFWDMDSQGSSATPGRERIFTFTPTVTGNYKITNTTTSGSSNDIAYFYKPLSQNCSPIGWTFIDDLGSGSTSGDIPLTAGVTYLFLGDPEFTSSTTRNVTILCPPGITSFAPTQGCPGQLVTITGNGFLTGTPSPTTSSGVNTVKFNGVDAASFTVVNSTTITAIVPTGGSSGNIVVHQGGSSGVNLTSPSSFTINNIPSLSATTGSPTYCPTQSITLNAVGVFTSWTWSGPNSFTSSLQNPTIPNATPNMAGVYSVIASNGFCSNSATVAVNVITSVVPTVTTVPASGTICPGDAITMNSSISANTFAVVPITYAPASTSGTNVNLSDDQLSGSLPIGFTFNFYGSNFTNFYISSNGFITFSSGAGNGCCSGQLMPNTSQPNNVIALAWEDLDPPEGGNIRYQTLGSSPNRRLVVSYVNIEHHPSNNPVQMQAILYESTNVIEIHTSSMPSDGGNHTMGVENSTGTSAVTVIGRNSTNWSVTTPEAYRFAPQTIVSTTWTGPGGTFSGTSLNFPSASSSNTGTYNLAVVSSSGCTANVSHTISLNAVPTAFSPVTIEACQGQTAYLNQIGIGGNAYTWTGPNGYLVNGTFTPNNPNLITSSANTIHSGQYRLIVTNTLGCRDTSFTQFTVHTNPVPTLTSLDSVSCPGYSDGEFVIGVTNGTPNYFFEYNSLGGYFDISSNGTFPEDPINLGSLYVTSDLYSVLVTDLKGCTGTISVNVPTKVNKAPVALCKNITIQLDATGNAVLTPQDLDNGSSDDCSTPALTLSQSNFNCSNVGTNAVTLTATDGQSATSSCVAIVTVQDVTPPVASCFNTTLALDATGNAVLLPSQINGGSSDACGVATVTVSPSVFTCENVGLNTVTMSATDIHGNTSTCQAIVTVTDNIAPAVSCQNLTVALDANGQATINETQIDNGSTDGCGIASMVVTPSDFSCANVGPNTVTLTVTDVNGNVSTCSATVTVIDNIAPAVFCQPITISLDATGNASITASQINNGSSDACGIASILVSPSSFTCTNVGSNTVTLTITDNNGNSSSCNTTVTVLDNIAPVATCQNISINLNASGLATISVAQIDNGSSDACGIASISVSPNTFTCANVGSNTVTLTVTDNNGNISTCTSTVTVSDITAPVVACLNLTVVLNASGNGSITASQVDNGSSDACGIASMVVSQTAFTCAHVGPNTVTLTVTDNNGNVSTCTAIITVVDNIAPAIVCQNISINLNASGLASITAAQIDNGSADACGIASMVVSPNSFTCANVGPNTVTLTVTDNNGNISTCTATVTVIDNTAPVVVCQNIAINLNASGLASISAAQIDNGSSDACGIASMVVTPNAFTCANVGANTVTLTVTDNNGNISTCTATVTVSDITAPAVACQNLTVILNTSGIGSITASQVDNGSSDACGIASMVVSQTAFTCAHVGPNTVTLTVTDNNGNVSTCTAIITVVDNIAPAIVCQNISINLDASGLASITAAQINNGSADACGIASMVVSPNSFTCANVGPNTVTLTVTDNNGNISSCTATVTIIDNTAPVASCQNISINLDATGLASITAAQIDNGSADACGIASMVVSPNAFTCANVGVNTVTLTVTDNNGNTSSCTATVTVNDITAPVAACQNLTVILDATGNGSITASQVDNGSADACGIASIAVSQNAFTCANVGPNTVTLTVTDNNGNISTCTATITVVDNIAPAIVCQNISIDLDATGLASITPAQIDNGTTDACGIASMSVLPNTFDCSNVGSNVVTLTVIDNNGNTSSCTATVTINDITAPVAICQNVTVYLDASGNSAITAAMIDNGSTDACGIASITVSPNAFTCAELGNNSVVLTITDVNNNVSTCNAIVEVRDTLDPVISCPASITVNNDPGQCGAVINYAAPVASDNCGITVALISGFPSGSVFPVGTTTNIYTVTDSDGNQATCSFDVLVNDTEIPTITGCPANFSACNPVTWTPPVITDNCPGVVIVSSHAPGATLPVGNTTITYTATDVYNNSSSCSFVVNRLPESVQADTITSNRAFHNICIGESITMTVSGGALGHGAQWKWYTGSCGGTLAGTGLTITKTPTVTTTYYMRAEGTCNNTACRQVTVVVSTTGPGNVTILSAPAVGAIGQSGTLTVSTPIGATHYQYTSNLGHIAALLFNGQIGPYLTSSNSVNVTFQMPLQNYQIRVIALNACGRSNTASTHIRGTVAQGTSITSSNGTYIACPGQTLSYTAASISGSNYYTWSLIPASAGTITGQGGLTVSVTYSAGFSGSAQLCYHGQTNFNLAGPDYCVTISTTAQTPGVINGNALPCPGTVGNYSIAAVPGATSYIWTTTIPGASVSGTGLNATVTFPPGSFSGNICVTANTSCGVSAASCLNITNGAPGVPDPISGPQSGVCVASNINYTINAPGATGFAWSSTNPNIQIASGGTSNSVLVNFLPGFTTGNLQVDVSYPCGTTPASISINGAPSVPTVAPAIICDGAAITYFASSQSATSFVWNATGTLLDYCLTPSCNSYYVEWDFGGTLSVTASNSCGSSPAFTAFSSCRMAQVDTQVYPNPTSGQATVEFEATSQATYSIKVTDLAGRIIINQEVTSVRGINQVNIDLTDSRKGLYLVHLNGQDGTSMVKRLVVE